MSIKAPFEPGAARYRILVVEDHGPTRTMLRHLLESDGYDVDEAADGEHAVSAFDPARHAVVLLDLRLPDMDGNAVLRSIRRRSDRPAVIMVTASDGLDDKVAALDGGAKDYITKPFLPRELLARVRASMRWRPHNPNAPGHPTPPGIVLDPRIPEIRFGHRRQRLSPLEYRLIRCLCERPGAMVPYAVLAAAVWGDDHAFQIAALRVLVWRLKRKIQTLGGNPAVLRNGEETGYSLTL